MQKTAKQQAMEFADNRFDLARLMTPTRHPWGRSFFIPSAITVMS